MPLEIDISGLRGAAGERLEFSLEEAVGERLRREAGEMGFTFVEPVCVQGSILNTGETFLVGARVCTTFEAVCGRCLRPFRQELRFDMQEEFREGQPPAEPTVSDHTGVEYFYFQGERLDLEEALRQNLLVELPAQPVCDPGCPGLCPLCGRRLEDGPCTCTPQEVDPRLEALRRFLKKEE